MRALVVWLAVSIAAVPAPAPLSFRDLLERSARGLLFGSPREDRDRDDDDRR